jgi:hypothetical protein
MLLMRIGLKGGLELREAELSEMLIPPPPPFRSSASRSSSSAASCCAACPA